MNDDLILLASAYLDDHASPDERARVETDPALLAEVERLRAVRLILGNVEPAKISVREAQLAAAFDVWDHQSEADRAGNRRDATPTGLRGAAAAGAASVSAPTRLSDRRRTPSTRWLTGAAAALVLVAAAGVALQSVGDSSDDAATTESADSATTDPVAAVDAEAEAGADAEADAEASSLEAADGSVQLDTGVDDPAPPREEAILQQLLSPQDLVDFAAPALGAPRAPDAPAATSAPVETVITEGSLLELTLCLGADIVVGPALYGDVLVVVGVDEGRSLALAYQPETCTEIARADLGSP